MTKEEAIELLKLQISSAEFYAKYTNNDKDAEKELKNAEAFRMAIEALEMQNNCIICPRCGREFSEYEGREQTNDE